MTVATVNEAVQLQSVRTWFDPLDMFRQIAPDGVVKKEAVDKTLTPDQAIDAVTNTTEIDQTPRPIEASTLTLPDRTVAPSAGSATAAQLQPPQSQKLVEAMGCPFAGTDPKDAVKPFSHPTGSSADGCPFMSAPGAFPDDHE